MMEKITDNNGVTIRLVKLHSIQSFVLKFKGYYERSAEVIGKVVMGKVKCRKGKEDEWYLNGRN